MIRYCVFVILILAGCAIPIQDNINNTTSQPEMPVVWFDSNGCYHSGDIIHYLNKVKSGDLKDPEMLQTIDRVVKEDKPVTQRDVLAIASGLDPINETAAIYLNNSEYIQNHTLLIQNHFNQPVVESGTLTVKYFGVQPQGKADMIEGTSMNNGFLAIPADPGILADATLDKDEYGVSILEDNLLNGSEKQEWQSFVIQMIPATHGQLRLTNLHPGPWILYQNQYGIMAFCYRVQVKAGKDQVLVADKLLWSPLLGNTARK